MYYQLMFLFSLISCVILPLNAGDFGVLHESEISRMKCSAENTAASLGMAQDRHEVLLNYFYIAARSAKCEYVFTEKYRAFQKRLALIRQASGSVDTAELAKQCAQLQKLGALRADHEKVLHHIEEHIDADEQLDHVFDQVRQDMTQVLNRLLVERNQSIDAMLAQADNDLNDDTLQLVAGFCRALLHEPELLMNESLALNKVDIISRLSQQLDKKMAAVGAVNDAMYQVAYFPLLVTYHYFNAAYATLYTRYVDTYSIKPNLLFGQDGALPAEEYRALPHDILSQTTC
jgi:hypothetical protein